MKNNIKIVAPDLPESVNNAVMLKWHKKLGDYIQEDELIAEIETDKIILEVSSPTSGIFSSQNISIGEKIKSKSILGYICVNNVKKNIQTVNNECIKKNDATIFFTPKMRRLIAHHNIDPFMIDGININGKITKNKFIIKENNLKKKKIEKKINKKKKLLKLLNQNNTCDIRNVTRIPMSPLRKKISERLLFTIKNTAMLTTFNEVNMQPIIVMRDKYQENFKKKYESKLGYMSFYVKAVTHALKKFPELNASINGTDIIYHDYYDINIAVSTSRGLVTPILKNTNNLSMFEIEKKINDFVILSQSGKLKLEDLESGTFTITNGGVFGSLLSTPIINPPQVAILGMHNIKNRPVVVKNEIKILPMMYLALSYDHQLIDGKQAIQFLNYIKDIIEDFSRIIIDI